MRLAHVLALLGVGYVPTRRSHAPSALFDTDTGKTSVSGFKIRPRILDGAIRRRKAAKKAAHKKTMARRRKGIR